MDWTPHGIPGTLCSNVYDFAFCPEPCYERLADLADPEDWGPGNRILKNYLSFSFSRAVFLTERDADQTAPSNLPLVFDDDRCLFNTGLYTRRYETIYGLFEPNTKPDARQRWFLKGFFKESDPMLVSFEYLPCRVRFAEDPSELVFDYRLPIRSNIDHILGDEENLTRIPASLMGEGNSLLLRRAFEGAVVEAARRAAANYTLAVPQFYGGRIQLLLPLCLTGDKPELALTIHARTVSTQRAPASRSTWPTTTHDLSAAQRPRGSSDKGRSTCWFVVHPDCGGAVCAHEFTIEGKKFLVNHARLC